MSSATATSSTASQKQTLLDNAMERVAEQEGDIYPLCLGRFYERFPDAREQFDTHGGQSSHAIEQSMLESTLYCLVTWFERYEVIRLVLLDANTQHKLLKVPTHMVLGLLDTFIEVILSAVPQSDEATRQVISEIQLEFGKILQE